MDDVHRRSYCYKLAMCVFVGHDHEPNKKKAEPAEVLFGIWTWVGSGNYVLSGGPDPQEEGVIFGDISRPIVKFRE